MISATDPNGNVTTSAYDADRRVASVTLPWAGGGPGPLVTAYSYRGKGVSGAKGSESFIDRLTPQALALRRHLLRDFPCPAVIVWRWQATRII